ncbi:MAG: hypothetical protein ACQETE_03030 [Bacteroidota bacterium]
MENSQRIIYIAVSEIVGMGALGFILYRVLVQETPLMSTANIGLLGIFVVMNIVTITQVMAHKRSQ